MAADPPLLEARGLARRSRQGEQLLAGVDLVVSDHDRLAVVGPSGSGKTLLLRALALLDPIDSGAVLWRGSEIHGDAVPDFRRRVIYLHQNPPLAEGTVDSNLRQIFSLRVHQKRQYDRSRILQDLAELGRDDRFLSKPTRQLSGGEGQIVALLRALQLEPAVILLDEPTAAVDPEAAEVIERMVAGWLGRGGEPRAYVWVSHDRQQATRVADRILTMRSGTFDQG